MQKIDIYTNQISKDNPEFIIEALSPADKKRSNQLKDELAMYDDLETALNSKAMQKFWKISYNAADWKINKEYFDKALLDPKKFFGKLMDDLESIIDDKENELEDLTDSF